MSGRYAVDLYSGVAQVLELSVTSAVNHAYERMVKLLFRPFELGRWFIIGFAAFLATLADGGGSGLGQNFNFAGPGGPGPGGTNPFSGASNWFQANLVWLLPLFLAGVGLAVLFIWLSSRGKFVFLDCVATGKARIKAPWAEHADLATSLFSFRVVVALLFAATLGALGIACLAIAWPDLQLNTFGDRSLIAAIVGLTIGLPLILAAIIISMLLDDFVIPAMYLRRESVMPAWRMVREEIIAPRTGKLFVFYLMKIPLAIATGIVATIAVLLTCCIGGLPYLNCVLLLPIYVFWRCYPLGYMEQFGQHWVVYRQDEQDLNYCSHCGYDLRGNQSGVCPECGTPLLPGQQPLPVDDSRYRPPTAPGPIPPTDPGQTPPHATPPPLGDSSPEDAGPDAPPPPPR
jgi:hypothetical protein